MLTEKIQFQPFQVLIIVILHLVISQEFLKMESEHTLLIECECLSHGECIDLFGRSQCAGILKSKPWYASDHR